MLGRLAGKHFGAPQISSVIVRTRRGPKGRHWACLRTGLTVVSGEPFVAERPIGILIPIDGDWAVRIETAQRIRVLACGEIPAALFTDQRRDRIGRALRTADAKQTGAPLRDIAISYFGARRVASEPWKTSALKAQVARLASYGHALTGDGYRQLLRGKTVRRSRD